MTGYFLNFNIILILNDLKKYEYILNLFQYNRYLIDFCIDFSSFNQINVLKLGILKSGKNCIRNINIRSFFWNKLSLLNFHKSKLTEFNINYVTFSIYFTLLFIDIGFHNILYILVINFKYIIQLGSFL